MNNMLTGNQIGTMTNTSAKNYNTNYGTTENNFQDWLGYGSARRQREYETYMSNTAYQRAVEDMKNAGLNPGLMFGSGSAASTPSGGSSASGKGLNVIGSIASLFLGSAKMMSEAKSMSMDKMIAKETMKLAAKSTARNNWYNRNKN